MRQCPVNVNVAYAYCQHIVVLLFSDAGIYFEGLQIFGDPPPFIHIAPFLHAVIIFICYEFPLFTIICTEKAGYYPLLGLSVQRVGNSKLNCLDVIHLFRGLIVLSVVSRSLLHVHSLYYSSFVAACPTPVISGTQIYADVLRSSC